MNKAKSIQSNTIQMKMEYFLVSFFVYSLINSQTNNIFLFAPTVPFHSNPFFLMLLLLYKILEHTLIIDPRVAAAILHLFIFIFPSHICRIIKHWNRFSSLRLCWLFSDSRLLVFPQNIKINVLFGIINNFNWFLLNEKLSQRFFFLQPTHNLYTI